MEKLSKYRYMVKFCEPVPFIGYFCKISCVYLQQVENKTWDQIIKQN